MIAAFNITKTGSSHAVQDMPCQDYSDCIRISRGDSKANYVVAAVADGVGSCEFSQHASEQAVKTFLSHITEKIILEGISGSDNQMKEVLQFAFEQSLNAVAAKAEEMVLPFTEFDTTLTGAVYDGKNLWFGHIGDDGIVALYTDGTYEMVTKRLKGEEINSVVPLREKRAWQFGKAPGDVTSFVMMTDGVLDFCVDCEAMGNRVFFPFLESALSTHVKTELQNEKLRREWEAFFEQNIEGEQCFKDVVTDDISFVAVINEDLLSGIGKIEFDREKWDRETAERRKMLDEALYGEYRKYKDEVIKQRQRENSESNIKAAEKNEKTSRWFVRAKNIMVRKIRHRKEKDNERIHG